MAVETGRTKPAQSGFKPNDGSGLFFFTSKSRVVDLNQSFFVSSRLEGYNADETFARAFTPWNRSSEVCQRMFMRAKHGESKNIFLPEVCIYPIRCSRENYSASNHPQVTPHAFANLKKTR